jgi:hypothetical protein
MLTWAKTTGRPPNFACANDNVSDRSALGTFAPVAESGPKPGRLGAAWVARWIKAGLGALLLLAAGTGRADRPLQLGPLAHEFSLTLAPGEGLEVLGPIFGKERGKESTLWRLSPLMSSSVDTGADSYEFDLLYPLLTYDRFGAEYRWQLVQLLSFAGGESQEEVDKDRFTLFPVYFQQRSTDSNLNYTAVLPFYGRLQNRLFRDKARFILWPVYVQSRKRDVITDNYLFPLFHLRHGDALVGWQFWPLLGHEHKGVSTRTNSSGETELVAGHDKRFVLWPIYFEQRLGLGTENPERRLTLLPAFSLQRSPERDSTTVIWPLFTVIDDGPKGYREWQVPWPIIVVTRGEGKTGGRVWPIYGRMEGRGLESEFFLWPLYKRNRATDSALDRSHTRIALVLFSDLTEKNLAHGTALQRRHFLPLFTWRRDHEDRERLQVLALLEPLFPGHKSIERNLSPLWSLWRSERNPAADSASQSLLWNLYRWERSPAGKKCSLLFGLFQYQSSPEGKQWRLFHIPIFRKRTAEADASAR